MKDDDFDDFAEIWGSAWEMVGRNLTGRAIVFAFDALRASYTLRQVQVGLALHCQGQHGREPPTVAHIVDVLGGIDDIPNVEEAWAIAVRAADESETVIWTEQIAAGWDFVHELYRVDEVGARMAFRAHYQRAIAVARATGQRPFWSVSAGDDPRRRAEQVGDALRKGRISEDVARHYVLPEPTVGLAWLLGEAGKRERDAKALAYLSRLKIELSRQLVGMDDGREGMADG